MDIKRLFEIQHQLDEHIRTNHPVLPGEDRLKKLILALQVELGECANEWRGFKYWSNNQNPNISELLMEYVDCLHFLLSIGNTLNIGDVLKTFEPEGNDVVDLFNLLFEHISFLLDKECQGVHFYSMVFTDFLFLGKQLGFTEDEVETAYLEKNKINYNRQNSGY